MIEIIVALAIFAIYAFTAIETKRTDDRVKLKKMEQAIERELAFEIMGSD